MILLDSSVWILIEGGALDLDAVVGDDDVALCPPVYQEVLQGLHSVEKYLKSRATLLQQIMLDAPLPLARFEEAARLYRRCRAAAYTIRRSTDCLIAASAIAHDVQLLHADRDFEHIAKVAPLKEKRLL